MDDTISEYRKAMGDYISLSKKETRTRILVQQARARVSKAKEAMRAEEYDLLDITNQA